MVWAWDEYGVLWGVGGCGGFEGTVALVLVGLFGVALELGILEDS